MSGIEGVSGTEDLPPAPDKSRRTAFRKGDVFGGWKLGDAKKSGSSTSVWQAQHVTGRIGVLKFLLNHTMISRFVREYKLTANVNNRWTPRAIDANLDLPNPWIAFEWLEADTLAEVVGDSARGPLRDDSLDEFGRQLWEAISYFAGMGMAHRDLSAGNVMLRRGDDRVVIVDWGTGRHDATDGTQTQHGFRSFTPGFGSPEQVFGDGHVGSLADVWGWGSVTYYAATGLTILPASDGDEYAEALRIGAAVQWGPVPERWLPALQAAMKPVKERDPNAVAECLPLRQSERELKEALAEAERSKAALAEAERAKAVLLAERDGEDDLVEADRQLLAGLAERQSRADAEVERLRQLVEADEVLSQGHPAEDGQEVPRRQHSNASAAALTLLVVIIGVGIWGITNRPATKDPPPPPTSSTQPGLSTTLSLGAATGPEPCKSKAEVADAVGALVEQAQETCAFRMVTGGSTARCPSRWVCTYDSNGMRTVQEGGERVTFLATAAIFRFRPAYYDSEPAAVGKGICELLGYDRATEARDSTGARIRC